MKLPRQSKASPGLKLLTISVVAGLLSFGLCGIGESGSGGGPIGDFLATAGMWLALLAIIGGGIGMILFLFTDNGGL